MRLSIALKSRVRAVNDPLKKKISYSYISTKSKYCLQQNAEMIYKNIN